MIAIAEDTASSTLAAGVDDRCVEVLRCRDAEALDPFREVLAAVCFDDEMDVIALDAHVSDAEVFAVLDDGVEPATNGVIAGRTAKVADLRVCAQRHE